MASTGKVFAGPVKRGRHILRAVSTDGRVRIEAWAEKRWQRSSYLLSDVMKGTLLTYDEVIELGIDAEETAEYDGINNEEQANLISKQRTDKLASLMTRHLHYQSLKISAAHERDPQRKQQREEEAEHIHAQIIAEEKNF